ncbi:hypothetical protein I9453_00060 [Campylobacter coli]|nr:hypothetical protein [Campylobacter coli]
MNNKALQEEIYGSREYQDTNKQNVNRLLTTYSETEYGERQDRGERGQLRREFNDRDFLRPADVIITQTTNENQAKKPIDFQAKLKEFTENKLQNKNPSKDKEINR